MGIEVRRVEREHVRREFEARDGRFSDGNLRLLQLFIRHLLRNTMEGLSGERRAWQARYTRQTAVKKFPQFTLGARCAGALDCHRDRYLAHRRTVLGANPAACPVDLADQVELLGNPGQCPDVADRARPHRLGRAQIRKTRRLGWPKHDLARDRSATPGVPHRLGRYTVTMTVYFSLEYVHVLSCIIFGSNNQGKTQYPHWIPPHRCV